MSESTRELQLQPIWALVLVRPMLDILHFVEIVDDTCPITEQVSTYSSGMFRQ
jgi:hypothetical protein